jgi:hypothetical protein
METAMKKSPIAVVAVFAAYAGPAIADETFQVGSDMAGVGPVRSVVEADGQRVQVVRNANDCAPFEAEAVWGHGSTAAPIGYRCFHPFGR